VESKHFSEFFVKEVAMTPPIVLTIAGSDSSGGAGIQADLKTIAAHNCYGASVITALTAQNTRGVTSVHTPPVEFLMAQLSATISDFPPAAVKIGMLPSAECVYAVTEALAGLRCPIVLDPVMVATSGASLAEYEAICAMIRALFPLATLITPNLREAEALCDIEIKSAFDMALAAKVIGYPVLLKAGHLDGEDANDLLCVDDKATWLRAKRLDIGDTHGTGCTLSTAIACNLALGHDLIKSTKQAKAWLTGLLQKKPDFGVPNGPLHHPGLRPPLHGGE